MAWQPRVRARRRAVLLLFFWGRRAGAVPCGRTGPACSTQGGVDTSDRVRDAQGGVEPAAWTLLTAPAL